MLSKNKAIHVETKYGNYLYIKLRVLISGMFGPLVKCLNQIGAPVVLQ